MEYAAGQFYSRGPRTQFDLSISPINLFERGENISAGEGEKRPRTELDTGLGSELKRRLRRNFDQADTSISRRYGGTAFRFGNKFQRLVNLFLKHALLWGIYLSRNSRSNLPLNVKTPYLGRSIWKL